MDIRDLFTPVAVAAAWEENGSNRVPYVGEALFPARKKAGLDLSWIRGAKGLPVSLMPSAFDAKATFRDRPGLVKTETEMPFFREGFKIKERDRQEILRVQDSNDPYLEQVLANIYDDANNLIEGAHVVSERMRMALLFPANGTPAINIKANGVDYSYNYDPDGSWKGTPGTAQGNYFVLSGTALWTAAATANPFNDFKTVKDHIVAKTGSEPSIALMNSYTFNLMASTQAVKDRFLSVTGRSVGFISDNDAAAVIKDLTGIEPVVYDKQFKDESGVAHKFIPDGYVSLLPEGGVGATWYGTTPEEADLRGANNGAKVAIVDTGIAVTQIIDPHPVNVNTFASEIVLPSFERMDEVALLKVVA